MFTSRNIVLSCVLWAFITLGVYFLIPSEVVRGIALGCLSSLIATLGVALMTYKSERLEYERLTHSSLKVIYSDLLCISNWVFGVLVESTSLAICPKGRYTDDIQEQYVYLERVKERRENIDRLYDRTTVLGSSLGALVANLSKVQVFKSILRESSLNRDVTLYKKTLDGLVIDVSALIQACREVYVDYSVARDLGVVDPSIGKAVQAHEKLRDTVDRVQDNAKDTLKYTENLILELEKKLGGNLEGRPWVEEKQTMEIAVNSKMTTDAHWIHKN